MENLACGDATVWLPSVRMTEVELVLQLHDLGRPRARQWATGTINTYERHADSKHYRHVQAAHSHGVSSHGVSMRIRSTVIRSSGEAPAADVDVNTK